MKRHLPFIVVAATISLAGCKHEPDPDSVSWEVMTRRINGRDDPRVESVASRYQPGNISSPGNGERIPIQISQDGVVAHPYSVRNVQTPPGIAGYNIRRRVDAGDPRVFHVFEAIRVQEEDGFWRADGDDAPIIEGQMRPAASIGTVAKQPDALRQETINLVGEQVRNNRRLEEKTQQLAEKCDRLLNQLEQRDKSQAELLKSYANLVEKDKANSEQIEKDKAEIQKLKEAAEAAANALGRKSRAKNTQIEGQ